MRARRRVSSSRRKGSQYSRSRRRSSCASSCSASATASRFSCSAAVTAGRSEWPARSGWPDATCTNNSGVRNSESQNSTCGGEGVVCTLEVVLFHEAADHGPVLVSLCLLRADEVGGGEHVDRFFVDVDGGTTIPKFGEWVDSAQNGHDVDAETIDNRGGGNEGGLRGRAGDGRLRREGSRSGWLAGRRARIAGWRGSPCRRGSGDRGCG